MRQASPWWLIYTCHITVAAIAAAVSAINAFKMWLSLLFLSTWADIIVMIHDPNYILQFELLFVTSFLSLQIRLHEIVHVFLIFGCRLGVFLVVIYSNSSHLFPWETYQLFSNSRNWLYLGRWRLFAHICTHTHSSTFVWLLTGDTDTTRTHTNPIVFNSFYWKMKWLESDWDLPYGSKSQSSRSMIKDKWDMSL